MTKGYVQVYTGDGKGKTTAAVGLAVRAAGAGLRVYFGQFLKDVPCCAAKALSDRFPEITVRQFGSGKGLLLGRDEKKRTGSVPNGGLRRVKRQSARKHTTWLFSTKSMWRFRWDLFRKARCSPCSSTALPRWNWFLPVGALVNRCKRQRTW